MLATKANRKGGLDYYAQKIAKRKRDNPDQPRCENCREEQYDSDGCCKWSRMQDAKRWEARDILMFARKKSKKREAEVCDNCGGDPDDGDGCCKWRSMQDAKEQEARDLLGESESEQESESEDGKIAPEASKSESKSKDDIYENCGEIASTEDDGCCKWRAMNK